MTQDEMAGWHHQFNGHEFEQAPGDCEGQGSLACCSPWDHKESDTTERLSLLFMSPFMPLPRYSCNTTSFFSLSLPMNWQFFLPTVHRSLVF